MSTYVHTDKTFKYKYENHKLFCGIQHPPIAVFMFHKFKFKIYLFNEINAPTVYVHRRSNEAP